MFSIYPFIHSSVTKLQRSILKTNELILMQIGTNGPWGKNVKQSTFGVMRSKLKVTQGRK